MTHQYLRALADEGFDLTAWPEADQADDEPTGMAAAYAMMALLCLFSAICGAFAVLAVQSFN